MYPFSLLFIAFGCFSTPPLFSGPDAPTVEELITPGEPGLYTATFQVNWMLSLNLEACAGHFGTKRFTCLNGDIELLDTLHENLECISVNNSVLECNETTV